MDTDIYLHFLLELLCNNRFYSKKILKLTEVAFYLSFYCFETWLWLQQLKSNWYSNYESRNNALMSSSMNLKEVLIIFTTINHNTVVIFSLISPPSRRCLFETHNKTVATHLHYTTPSLGFIGWDISSRERGMGRYTTTKYVKA